MRAIAVKRGESRPRLLDIPRPEPQEGEVLVKTLRVGIDGTDHEVIAGAHGTFPENESYQILGHEAVGVVVDANGTDAPEGELVVPTVRRPPNGESNEYFERGEPDMAPPGHYVERGIVGAHGYMASFFTSPAEFLVSVPTELAETGFLIEPISNSEKAIELAYASRSTFEWAPETALVLGNGPLGLLSLGLLEQHDFARTYCLGRRSRPDRTIDIIERFGATYVDSRETPVDDVAKVHEPMDLVYEATGHAAHAFETLDALAPSGVGVLLGIPSDQRLEIDGGRLHREFVLENKALVGSVNSHVPQFQRAIDTITGYPDWVTDAIITDVFDPEEVDSAFDPGKNRIKTVVEFATL